MGNRKLLGRKRNGGKEKCHWGKNEGQRLRDVSLIGSPLICNKMAWFLMKSVLLVEAAYKSHFCI